MGASEEPIRLGECECCGISIYSDWEHYELPDGNKIALKDFWNIHVHNCSMFKLTFKSDNIEGSEDKCLEFFEGYTDGIDKDSAW